jgi:hypothetical protein
MGLSSEEFFFTLSTKGKKASSRYFKKIVAAWFVKMSQEDSTTAKP